MMGHCLRHGCIVFASIVLNSLSTLTMKSASICYKSLGLDFYLSTFFAINHRHRQFTNTEQHDTVTPNHRSLPNSIACTGPTRGISKYINHNHLNRPSSCSFRIMRSSIKSSALSVVNFGSARLSIRRVLRIPSTVGEIRLL